MNIKNNNREINIIKYEEKPKEAQIDNNIEMQNIKVNFNIEKKN